MKIVDKKMKESSANKDFVHLKDILTTVSDNMKLELNIDHMFKKMRFKQEDSESEARLPFETDFIVNTLLSDATMAHFKEQEKYFIYACAETGARPSELTMLKRENIFLDTEIPFIRITPDETDQLKTRQSKRDLPLVGYALEAFKASPDGFTDWYKDTDKLTTKLNRKLRSIGVLVAPEYSLYSLRHSFSDRLLAEKVSDKIEMQLMGHKLKRTKYGKGATLASRLEEMQKVQLKPR